MASGRRSGGRGSTMLIVVGVVAALAVMSATLVVVVGNMQANTADTRTRDKAAGVAEAAMDAQMFALARNWPQVATPSPVPTMDAATVRTQFSVDDFPAPQSGSFTSAAYYDNSDTNGDNVVDTSDAAWDANGDNLMYVEGQGRVQNRGARFQALVERTFISTWFPQGLAVWDGGDLDSNGAGGQIRVHYQGSAPPVQANVIGEVDDGD